MRILVVNPSELSNNPARETNPTGVYPPLGLAYIAAVLVKRRYSVKVLDARALRMDRRSFSAYIKANPADIVMFTSTTLMWPDVVSSAEIVKAFLPRCFVVAGGPQLSVYPIESLSAECVDYGIRGEGENTVLSLVDALSSGRDPRALPGIVYKEKGIATVNQPSETMDDINDIPFPAVQLFPLSYYRSINVRSPFFTMVTSRGCPYSCGFCSQVYTERFRLRSAENVVEEMELYVREYGAREIVLFDETFTVDKQRVLDICRLIGRRKLHFRWNVRTRVDTVDREILEHLKHAGCRTMHMGVESGSQRVLDSMNKGITLEQVKRVFREAHKLGFETRGYFMIGYPGESLAEIKDTLDLSRDLQLDWASFTVTVPHPATEIYRRALAGGDLKSDYWQSYTLRRNAGPVPYFVSAEYDRDGLEKILRKAYSGFYLRPGFIAKKIFSSNAPLLINSIVRNTEAVTGLFTGKTQ